MRKDFLKGALGFAALPAAECAAGFAPSAPLRRSEERQNELVAKWDEATKAVAPQDYFAYFRDGDTREFKALKALEHAFDKVLREARETVVSGDASGEEAFVCMPVSEAVKYRPRGMMIVVQ